MAKKVKPKLYGMETNPVLTRRQRELLLMVVGRKESAYLSVCEQLKPEHFGEEHRDLGIIWSIVCDHFETYERMPSEEEIATEFERRLEESGDDFSDDELLETDDFLRRAFSLDMEHLNTPVAQNFAKQLIQENLVSDIKDALTDSRGTPSDLIAILSDFTTKAEHATSVSSGRIERITDGGWNTKPIVRTPTNVPVIDGFIGGGDTPQEVYGFMAPYGTCKTLLMVQLSAERAKLAYNMWLASKRQASLGLVYYFQYEEPLKPEILVRLCSYTAQIHKERLEGSNNWERDLSRSHNLQEYEKKLFAKQLERGEKVRGEWERLMTARTIMDHNWIGVGMNESGNADSAKRGSGGIAEIAALIGNDMAYRKEELKTDVHVAGVYIDYIGAAVDRFAEATNKDDDAIRRLLTRYAMHLRNRVLTKYQAPGWVCHQFSAEGNAKTPGAVLHHTMSSECKTIAENWNFALNIGSKDSNECCVISQSKGRRTGYIGEKILKVDGAFSRILDTNGAYRLDNNRIVEASDFFAAGHSEEQQMSRGKSRQPLYIPGNDDDDEDMIDAGA